MHLPHFLYTLLQQAERERDAAQAALRDAEDAEARARQQAAQLQQYALDYRARWGAQAGRAGTVLQLQCYQGFMQRLDQAMEQQARQCELGTQRAAQARTRLQATELRVAALRKLIERRQQAEQALAGRRAQKQTDEAAQRAGWAARAVADFH